MSPALRWTPVPALLQPGAPVRQLDDKRATAALDQVKDPPK